MSNKIGRRPVIAAMGMGLALSALLGGTAFAQDMLELKLATAEEDANLRGEWLHFLANDTDRAVPLLLADANEVVVEDMLELGLTTDREPALRNYAAYMLLRKRLDELALDPDRFSRP